MISYVLVGIDPFAQPGVDFISKFNSLDERTKYIENWLKKMLNKQESFVSGLKGDINRHINKYMENLKNTNELIFYGEYKIESSEPYTYKWLVYNL